jgi:N-acetyl-anhydromuramyl-L-alanine amidase AmpD
VSYSLTWLADVLRAAGLRVAEQSGWQDRGLGDVGPTLGVICHHTAGPLTGNMPSLGVVTNGRPDLQGPLAQLCLGRDGTYYVVAAGHANHAGAGNWQGVSTGNTSFIGIEAENAGTPNDPWPQVQMDAYQRGVAAILAKAGAQAIMCCGHKEYALPPGRKTDPSFDMTPFRAAVSSILAGSAPAPTPVPAQDSQNRPTLVRGASGDLVTALQTKLGVTADGQFGAATEAAVRAFQTAHGLTPDGIVGPQTWAALS